MITHGHTRNGSDTPEYRSWRAMMRRCYTQSDQKYFKYGGIGIEVCQRWHSFQFFLDDMGPRPTGHTIDRFPDRDGNYEPSNCRWATQKQQQRNRRNSRMVCVDGVVRPLGDVIEERQLKYYLIVSRVKRGWSPEEALLGRRLVLRPMEAKS